MLLSIIASIAGILIIFSIIPQILKIKENKSVENISRGTYYMLLIASLLLVIYGFEIFDIYIAISFLITAISSFLVILQIRQYSQSNS